jgi:hypothetical protein
VGRSLKSTDGALVDRDWRGYHPRAAVPAVALAALASAVLLVGRWWLDDPSDFADRSVALAFYVMTLAVWPALLTTLVYRMVTYTYRVTDKAVLVDRGFRQLPEPPLELAELIGAGVDVNWLGRQLGVGRVVLKANGDRVLALSGVRHPETFVAAIGVAAENLKTTKPAK